jgi:hypothetical protein
MQIPETKIVVIVQFNNMPPQSRPIYYQVTIDPDSVTGEFIRLGQNAGDEIQGWQRVDSLDILHILAKADEKGELQPPPRA